MEISTQERRRDPEIGAALDIPARSNQLHFSELYRRASEAWPDTVSVSDGYPTGNNGYEFPTLTRNFRNIVSLSTADPALVLTHQAIYEVSVSFSKYLAMSGVNELKLSNVPVDDVAVHLEVLFDKHSENAELINDSEEVEQQQEAA